MKDSVLKRWVVLSFGILFSGLLLFFSSGQQIGLHVLSMLILVIISMYVVKFDLWHPYMWYSFFFFLYSSSYSINYLLTGSLKYGYSKEMMALQWIGFVVFLLIVGPKVVVHDKDKVLNKNDSRRNITFLIIIECLLSMITLMAAYMAITGGYSSKGAMYLSGKMIFSFGSRCALLLNILFIYHEIKYYCINKKIDKKILLLVGIVEVIFSLCSGERDRMIIFGIETIYLLYYIGKISKKSFLLFIPVILVSLPLMTMFKYKFMTGSINSNVRMDSLGGILSSFFSDEFYTVGRNMMLLINNKVFTKGYFGGQSIINDFIRIVVDTSYNNASWFSKEITRTKGYGFTIIGEGYVNFGIYGIVLVMAFVALITKIIYNRSNKNLMSFIVYIYMIPIIIYSIRADIANILSPLIIHTSIAGIIVWVNNRLKTNKVENNTIIVNEDVE